MYTYSKEREREGERIQSVKINSDFLGRLRMVHSSVGLITFLDSGYARWMSRDSCPQKQGKKKINKIE